MSRQTLGAFLRQHADEILAIWDRSMRELTGTRALSHPALHDEIGQVLEAIATQLEDVARGAHATASRAVGEHILQRAELGVTSVVIAGELFALRDAIEAAWPLAREHAAIPALAALRSIIDELVLTSLARFVRVRFRLLDAVDSVVRRYPGDTIPQTLQDVLRVLIKSVDGVDTAAILLREHGDLLRVRAAVGLEEEVDTQFATRIGEGFAGLIAAEQRPRLVTSAATDPIIASPVIRGSRLRALYGVPLVHGDELFGVAHMGSSLAPDFPDAAKAVFRIIMERVAGVVYQQMLKERLQLEQARYAAVVENAPPVIYSKDRAGRYLTINRRALGELGWTPEQFIGRTDHDVFAREAADRIRATDQRVMEERTTIELEEEIQSATGARRAYLTVKFPITDARGHVTGIGGVSTDITDRRREERGHELLSEVGGILASSLDEDRTLGLVTQRVVPRLADCCIVDVIDEGMAVRSQVHHRDPARARLAHELLTIPIDRARPHLAAATLQSHQPVFMPLIAPAYLASIAQSDAHLRMLQELDPTSMIQIPLVARDRLLGAWVFLRCGPGTRYDPLDLALARELGWRTSLALDNARLYRIAQRAIRAREDVLGMVAHDLRTPIGTIALAADTVRESLPAEAQRERRQLDQVARAATRMSKLVSDLLDQHAIESGELALDVQRCPAAALLHDVIEAHRDALARASIVLDVAIADDLPLVLADLHRLQQVFDNLLANAARFTPPGGRITLSVRAEADEVWFSVVDTGEGFAVEALPHLFDRYWRADRADRRGTGLGLAISKGIIEAHGGRIWATNDPRGGAIVTFALPHARDRDARHIERHHLH